MANHAYNLPAAFVGYVAGGTFEELSALYSIPIEHLKLKAKEQGWAILASKVAPGGPMPVMMTGGAEGMALVPAQQKDIEGKLARIEANREKVLGAVRQLQDDLLEQVAALREGRMVKRVRWCHRGVVTEIEAPIDLEDRNALVAYAQKVADLSYRALGDFGAAGERGGGGGGHGPGSPIPDAPSITIILPQVISRPREDRPNPQSGPTIDVEPTDTQADSGAPQPPGGPN